MKAAEGEQGASAESAMQALLNLQNKEHDIQSVFSHVKEISKPRKFSESVELILKLNVDPTQGDQNVRGTCILPCGTGQQVRVLAFADKEFHSALEKEGCDLIGSEEIIKEIASGAELKFDKIIATQEFMPALKSLARILGPKGLMPNVKSGTLVKPDDLIETVS